MGDPLRRVLRYGSVGVEDACEIDGNIETVPKFRDERRTRGNLPASARPERPTEARRSRPG
ncbi:MAG: hypothetical protein LAN36_04015 [Acidobacteriia bacterium]|nr:hypothetical protein [Terriglobia bacterium]